MMIRYIFAIGLECWEKDMRLVFAMSAFAAFIAGVHSTHAAHKKIDIPRDLTLVSERLDEMPCRLVEKGNPDEGEYWSSHTCDLGNGYSLSFDIDDGRTRVTLAKTDNGRILHSSDWPQGFSGNDAPIALWNAGNNEGRGTREDEAWGVVMRYYSPNPDYPEGWEALLVKDEKACKVHEDPEREVTIVDALESGCA